jgi:hypothetical protein
VGAVPSVARAAGVVAGLRLREGYGWVVMGRDWLFHAVIPLSMLMTLEKPLAMRMLAAMLERYPLPQTV